MTRLARADRSVSEPVELRKSIEALLAAAGAGAPRSIAVCSDGGNNRIHRVETADGLFAVKEYFRHPEDPRDRLGAEAAFLKYANEASPAAAPRLLASDPPAGLALFEFIDGHPIVSGGVVRSHVEAAIAFFRDLNAPARRSTAGLPVAAEAAFSLSGQLALIEARIAQLHAVSSRSSADARAAALVRRLGELWTRVAAGIRDQAGRGGLDDRTPHRCISPSDFGFHNALVTPGGRVRFIDFEYAGWDDPAKTVGDFFAQLAVPVPTEYFEDFVSRCTEVLAEPAGAARRAVLMRPAYRVKWCCIALNVFLPVHLARRRFANPALDEDALKEAQMEKAEQLMASIARDAH